MPSRRSLKRSWREGSCSEKHSELPRHGFSVPSVRGIRPCTQSEIFNRSKEVGASRRSRNHFTFQRMQHHRICQRLAVSPAPGLIKKNRHRKPVWRRSAAFRIIAPVQARARMPQPLLCRPEPAAALADAPRLKCAVIVAKLDRLSTPRQS